MYSHTLIQDVKSHSKGNIYAKAGEKCNVISEHGEVWIMESEKVVKFSTNKSNLKEIKL